MIAADEMLLEHLGRLSEERGGLLQRIYESTFDQYISGAPISNDQRSAIFRIIRATSGDKPDDGTRT